MRGARVKNIVRELNNEKVDLFKWSANIRELVVEALKPAKLKTLEVDEAAHKVTVLVDEENLVAGHRPPRPERAPDAEAHRLGNRREEGRGSRRAGLRAEAGQGHRSPRAEPRRLDPSVAEKIVRAGFLSVEGIAEVEPQDLVDGAPDVDPALIAARFTRKPECAAAAPQS